MRNITLITMGAGNVKVLRETIQSFWGIVNEVIFGDMLLFPEDRRIVHSYKDDFNIVVKELPFNFLYHNGFSETLNTLASFAKNDLVLYMNVGETIDVDYGITEIVNNNPRCNTFYFTHHAERHRWFRLYDRRDLKWSGKIHEELQGEYRPYHKPIFMMKDLPKDMENVFKAKVFDSVKEVVYWKQLMDIVDDPSLLAATSPGWLEFAKENYDSMKERLSKKGMLPYAIGSGNMSMLKEEIFYGKSLEKEKFASSDLIAFQQDRKHLL